MNNREELPPKTNGSFQVIKKAHFLFFGWLQKNLMMIKFCYVNITTK